LSALRLLARRLRVVLEALWGVRARIPSSLAQLAVALRYRAVAPTRGNVDQSLSFSGFSINHAD
jgi:hypothetical protein